MVRSPQLILLLSAAACVPPIVLEPVAPDGGARPQSSGAGVEIGRQVCDPVRKAGCDASEICVWSVHDDGTSCAPPLSTLGLGDPCNADQASCAAGFTCTALRDDPGTRCYAVCDPVEGTGCEAHDTPDRKFACLPLADLSYGLCAMVGNTCDPLQPRACDDQESCTLFGGQTACARAGEVQKEGVCDDAACAPGLLCIKLEDRRFPVCLSPCDTGSPTCPGGSEVCTALEGLAFGVCQTSVVECSPLEDRCPADQVCSILGTNVACAAAGPAVIGSDCTDRGCGRGGVCAQLRGEAGATCREPCDLRVPRCSSPTAECHDIGLSGFGVCR